MLVSLSGYKALIFWADDTLLTRVVFASLTLMASSSWQTQNRFLEMRTQWLTLIGEHLIDNQGQTLEYWRIEKADSVIILPIHRQKILLPLPTYRPGVGETTWDFPGGRVSQGQTPSTMVPMILKREMGIGEDAIALALAGQLTSLKPLDSTGWAINSAFSNQRLYGFAVDLNPALELDSALIGNRLPATQSGIQDLLSLLTCLQCRAVLLQWWLAQNMA